MRTVLLDQLWLILPGGREIVVDQSQAASGVKDMMVHLYRLLKKLWLVAHSLMTFSTECLYVWLQILPNNTYCKYLSSAAMVVTGQ